MRSILNLHDDFNFLLDKIEKFYTSESKFYDIDDISVYNNVIEFTMIVECSNTYLTMLNVKYDLDDAMLYIYNNSRMSKHFCLFDNCVKHINNFVNEL